MSLTKFAGSIVGFILDKFRKEVTDGLDEIRAHAGADAELATNVYCDEFEAARARILEKRRLAFVSNHQPEQVEAELQPSQPGYIGPNYTEWTRQKLIRQCGVYGIQTENTDTKVDLLEKLETYWRESND